MKHVEDIETGHAQLCVFECDCGFYIRLDATFLEQVSEIKIPCPVCGETIDTGTIPDCRQGDANAL